MIKILFLFCALSTARDACTEKTAVAHVRGPLVSNEMSCIMGSQAILTESGYKPDFHNSYLKVVCER